MVKKPPSLPVALPHTALSFMAVLLIAGALWAPPSLAAQATEPIRFEEWYRDVVQVQSPGVLAGVTVGDPSGMRGALSMVARTVSGPWTSLCVTVASRDVRYFSRIEYDLVGRPAGNLLLAFPSAYADIVRGYDHTEIAVLAEAKDGCAVTSPTLAVFVTAWDTGDAVDTVRLLVNSGNSEFTRVRVGSAETLCTRLARPTTAYNMQCEVPLDEVSLGEPIVVQRIRFQRIRSTTIPLRVP